MAENTSHLSTALADRYRIERRLGEGGMATVYLAEDLKHKRKVAVKVLRPELAAVLGAERFVQEITTTANLQHPNILPLFDSGEADSFLYYVMPFIDGETLRDKLNREMQLGIEEAVSIATAVADALDYAHRQGVIHRDIKPENILLHDGRPMVADFGIALAKSEGTRLTETGVSMGTPQYMSPEQVTGDWEVDGRCDVYAVGAVLYEMLTGEAPHTGNTAQAILARLLSESPTPVGDLRDTVPRHVAAAVHRSLAKIPTDRFPTAAEFATALVDSDDRPSPPRAAQRSPWVWVATSALVIIAAVGLLWRPWVTPATGITSVAVLPLDNLSGDSGQNIFVDGIHDALIAELQQLSAFERVISRTSVLQYRDTEQPIPEIATALGVDAIAMMKRARELDPLSAPINADLAGVYLHARRYNEARTENERTLAITPGFHGALWRQIFLDVLGGADLDRAITVATELEGAPSARSLLAFALAGAGRDAEARVRLEEDIAAAGGPERLHRTGTILAATVYLDLGDTVAAWDMLERTVALGIGSGLTNLVVWPFFDPLREDPRFEDLVARMGYPR